MMKKHLCVGCVVAMVAGTVIAAPFTRGNLVVLGVSNENVAGSGSVSLFEYTRSGGIIDNVVNLPSSGADAMALPWTINHDRHLHRSLDKRYLTFGVFNGAPGAADISATSVAAAHRVVGRVSYNGTLNLSTRLTDCFDFTGFRGVASTDGTAFWLSGDNASGATLTGGLRYTTLGASTTVNLSQVQAFGGAKTPDNTRDAAIFDGQLYTCSGSSASIGKALLKAGTGLPTSGAQTQTLLTTDGASTSSFYFLDASTTIPGVDVVYTAATTNEGVHKYVKQPNGTWAAKGIYAFPAVFQIIATLEPDGSATIFVGSEGEIRKLTDATPFTGTISSATPATTIITAPDGYKLGGIEFAPERQSCAADFNADGFLDFTDFDAFVVAFEAGDGDSDFNSDGFLDFTDFDAFVNAFETGC
jgi:hypothetical protein